MNHRRTGRSRVVCRHETIAAHMLGRLAALLGAIAVAITLGLAAHAHAAPAQPDPKQMSGIPRADPAVPAGTVTVRCLGEGGFSQPLADLEVALDVTAPDGSTVTKTAKTQGEGRATFEGLAAGSKAIARATIEGAEVRSLPIEVAQGAGVRVLLVAGAQTAAHGANAPMPGRPFPLSREPAGKLIVAALDISKGQPDPVVDIDVTLSIAVPGNDPDVRKAKTDKRGSVSFEGLLPPEIPPEAKLEVTAELPDGTQGSGPFVMDAQVGTAIVFTMGGAAHPPAGVTKLPPPRVFGSLPPGTVRVRLVDGRDRPVTNQPVQVLERTMAGDGTGGAGITDAQGVVTIAGLSTDGMAGFFVETRYDNAPYRSQTFGMDGRGGVGVDLRVWETTSDPSVVRSALQFDVEPVEQDKAQIVQVYEAIVRGDKAFWPGEEFRLDGAPGAKNFIVLAPAEPWLHHDESAPFATLMRPMPPDEVVNLSVAYLVDHDSEVKLEWTPPFEVVETSVLVGVDLGFEHPNAAKSEQSSPIPGKEVYVVGGTQRGDSVAFKMTGLRIRDPLWRYLAIAGSAVLILIVIVNLILPRTGLTSHLRTRRDALLAALERCEARGEPQAKRDAILKALDRVYRQLATIEALEKDARTREAAATPASAADEPEHDRPTKPR